MRWIALAEATTFLALLVASVIKRTADNEIGVQILGPIHGPLFIAYVVNVFSIRESRLERQDDLLGPGRRGRPLRRLRRRLVDGPRAQPRRGLRNLRPTAIPRGLLADDRWAGQIGLQVISRS